MSDFFYRQCDVKLPTGGRIRNNAYIRITSLKDESVILPIEGKTMTDTYDPQGTGRPAPILKETVIKLEGEAGSLRRIEGGFTCYDVESFNKFEDALLVPGRKIKVEYGYVGPELPSESAEYEFTVYDYSFSITKENYFDCSFKGVGKGGTYEQNNINTQAAFPAREFVTNYKGFNDVVKVGNIFDYIDYQLQKSGHPDGSILSVLRSRGGTVFAPGHGTSGQLSDKTGNFAFLKAPEEYTSPTAFDGGFLTNYYLQYITLGALVNIINKFTLDVEGAAVPKYRMVFHPDYSKLQCKFPSGLVWSADPVQMLFPYPKGTPENTYDEEPATQFSDQDDYVSVDHIKKYDALGTEKGDPEHILISRDLLRAVQKAFNDQAKTEKNKEEESEKASGQIILNRFMKAIFASIRDNSGGAWDLYLDQDDSDPSMETIFIINRKSPGGDKPIIPFNLDPVGGENGIREVKIEASVPKEMQAKAFGGAPDVQSEEELTVQTIKQDNQSTERDKNQTAMDVAEQQTNARKGLTEGEYATSVISKAKAALTALVNEMTAEEKAAKGQFKDGADKSQIPFPLTFSVTLDGIEGFKFGDTISTSLLPARYRDPYGNLKIVFTVTKYEHKIANNDWTTTVTALCRIRKA